MDAVLHLILQAGDAWGSAPWHVAEEVMLACFGDHVWGGRGEEGGCWL